MVEEFLRKLKEDIEANGNVVAMSMVDLRNGFEYKRLGVHVTGLISDRLISEGLGHAPDELPQDQWATVLIYRKGTSLGRVIDAVLQPSPGGANILRELTGSDAAEIISKVKALVCD